MTAPVGRSGASPAVIELEPLTVTGTPPPVVNLDPVTVTARPTPPPPSLSVPVDELVLPCLSQIDAVAMVAVGVLVARQHPALAIMGAFKAGLDLSKCVSNERDTALARASVERARARCLENGGTPAGVAADGLHCLVPADDP